MPRMSQVVDEHELWAMRKGIEAPAWTNEPGVQVLIRNIGPFAKDIYSFLHDTPGTIIDESTQRHWQPYVRCHVDGKIRAIDISQLEVYTPELLDL